MASYFQRCSRTEEVLREDGSEDKTKGKAMPLTESQAWNYLRRKWSKPSPYLVHGKTLYGVFIRRGRPMSRGLCSCLGSMSIKGIITYRTYLDMLIRVQRVSCNGEQRLTGFKWPRTKQGAQQRAGFCERQQILTRRHKRAE